MSNKRKSENLVDSSEVGGVGTLSEVQTISCRFHDFANLPHEQDESIKSFSLKCHGHKWKIELYPGGQYESDEGFVGIYLGLMSKISRDLRVKSRIRLGPIENESTDVYDRTDQFWGLSNYVLRTSVLDPAEGFLDDEGALVVKVDIQIYSRTKKRPVWKPKKQRLQVDMLKLLESSDDADVTFIIGETKFHVHSLILKTRAPTLASMAEDADGREVNISNVEPHVFRHLLRNVYGDEVPSSSDIKRDARAYLEASDRFGCSGMKLHVESEVVRSVLRVSNAADWTLFADSHSCALLKEAAIALFASNSKAVMASAGWAAVTESADIMKELMNAAFSGEQLGPDDDETNAKKMSVSSLRETLEKKGIDVDGTREMLVERLEEAQRSS